jgi:hypothetical protein
MRRIGALCLVLAVAGCGTPAVVGTSSPEIVSPHPQGASPSSAALGTHSPSMSIVPSSGGGPARWTTLTWPEPVALPAGAAPAAILSWAGGLVVVGAQTSFSGQSPAAWFSSDGRNWAQTLNDTSDGPTGSILRVAASGDRLYGFGIVGSGSCTEQGQGASCVAPPIAEWTSANGRDWRRVILGDAFSNATLRAVAGGPGGVVAIGELRGFPTVWFAKDGEGWVAAALPALDGGALSDVVAYPGGWVVAGSTTARTSQSPDALPRIWASSDGSRWSQSRIEMPRDAHGGVARLGIAGGVLFAIGDATSSTPGIAGTGYEWTSRDANTWELAPVDDGAPSSDIISDGAHALSAQWMRGDRLGFAAFRQPSHWDLMTAVNLDTAPRWDVQRITALTQDALVVIGLDSSGPKMIWIAGAT